MTAMKVIHAQSALTWNQVAQNKSDVKFIVKTHFSLHTHTHTHTHTHLKFLVYMATSEEKTIY